MPQKSSLLLFCRSLWFNEKDLLLLSIDVSNILVNYIFGTTKCAFLKHMQSWVKMCNYAMKFTEFSREKQSHESLVPKFRPTFLTGHWNGSTIK